MSQRHDNLWYLDPIKEISGRKLNLSLTMGLPQCGSAGFDYKFLLYGRPWAINKTTVSEGLKWEE